MRLSVIELVGLILGLAGELDAQLAVSPLVGGGQDDGAVGLTALKMGQGLQRPGGLGVQIGGGGQGDEHLVGVQPGVPVAQVGIFMSLMGAMMDDGSRSSSLSMPARALMAFSSSAAEGPSRELFFR